MPSRCQLDPRGYIRIAGPDCNHVPRDQPAAPHACVVAITDDVGEAIVGRHLDLDAGIVRQEFLDGRP